MAIDLSRPPSDFRYRSFVALTREYVCDLPLEGVTFGRRYTGEVGDLRARLPLAAGFGSQATASYSAALTAIGGDALAKAGLRRLNDGASAGRRLVVVEASGTPVWGGLITRCSYSAASASYDFQAQEIWTYFNRYPLRANLDYGLNGANLQDQTSAIFKGLIDWVQAQPFSNLGVDTSAIAASGVLRERHYVGTDRSSVVGDLAVQLARVINGFEFVIDTSYDANRNPIFTMRTGYPRLGIAYDPFNPGNTLSFEYPGTVADYSWPEDGLAYATLVDSTSVDSVGTTLIATSTPSPNLTAAGYPAMPRAVRLDKVSESQTLQQHADANAAKYGTTVGIPAVTVRLESLLGYAGPGDDFLLKVTDHRFPDGYTSAWRLLGWDASVDQRTATLIIDTTNGAGAFSGA